jgi:hypothetical protein
MSGLTRGDYSHSLLFLRRHIRGRLLFLVVFRGDGLRVRGVRLRCVLFRVSFISARTSLRCFWAIAHVVGRFAKLASDGNEGGGEREVRWVVTSTLLVFGFKICCAFLFEILSLLWFPKDNPFRCNRLIHPIKLRFDVTLCDSHDSRRIRLARFQRGIPPHTEGKQGHQESGRRKLPFLFYNTWLKRGWLWHHITWCPCPYSDAIIPYSSPCPSYPPPQVP